MSRGSVRPVPLSFTFVFLVSCVHSTICAQMSQNSNTEWLDVNGAVLVKGALIGTTEGCVFFQHNGDCLSVSLASLGASERERVMHTPVERILSYHKHIGDPAYSVPIHEYNYQVACAYRYEIEAARRCRCACAEAAFFRSQCHVMDTMLNRLTTLNDKMSGTPRDVLLTAGAYCSLEMKQCASGVTRERATMTSAAANKIAGQLSDAYVTDITNDRPSLDRLHRLAYALAISEEIRCCAALIRNDKCGVIDAITKTRDAFQAIIKSTEDSPEGKALTWYLSFAKVIAADAEARLAKVRCDGAGEAAALSRAIVELSTVEASAEAQYAVGTVTVTGYVLSYELSYRCQMRYNEIRGTRQLEAALKRQRVDKYKQLKAFQESKESFSVKGPFSNVAFLECMLLLSEMEMGEIR